MRTMLLSFKSDVYKKILSGEKIYEHRKVFPDEPIKAYLYVSRPVYAITGIIYLGKKHSLLDWKNEYAYDSKAISRIDDYLQHHRYAIEILEFQETTLISLKTLRNDFDKFVVPQMYYYLDGTPLLCYLEKNLQYKYINIKHEFVNIASDKICIH
jgi:predicted transcriptional regulator